MIHRAAVQEQGYCLSGVLLPVSEIATLTAALLSDGVDARRRGGLRDVLNEHAALSAVASHAGIVALVHEVLSPAAFVVRATLFDKTPEGNWKVPRHQDLTIAVEALLMRPLLLHASSASIQPEHRRVLHLDFATGELPNGLRWRRLLTAAA